MPLIDVKGVDDSEVVANKVKEIYDEAGLALNLESLSITSGKSDKSKRSSRSSRGGRVSIASSIDSSIVFPVAEGSSTSFGVTPSRVEPLRMDITNPQLPYPELEFASPQRQPNAKRFAELRHAFDEGLDLEDFFETMARGHRSYTAAY